MVRFLSTILMPVVALVGSWWLLNVLGLIPGHLLTGVAEFLLAVAAFTCWRFRRSRAILPLAMAAFVLWFLGIFDSGGLGEALALVWLPALAVLLAFNWPLAALFGDRGLWGRVPMLLTGFMVLQGLVVMFMTTGAFGAADLETALYLQGWTGQKLQTALVDPSFTTWTTLPQLALALGVVGSVLLLVRSAWAQSPVDAGLAVGLWGALGALHFAGTGPEAASLCVGVALAVTVPLVQDSYRMAFVDELTGLSARRSLMSDMQNLGGRYSVAMADIDHFKKFNDTYGHDTGDEVLRMVSSRLDKVGGGGRAYRYGGEEFTILFPRKGADQAVKYLEEVREAIANAGFTVRTRPRPSKKPTATRRPKAATHKVVTVTISMGVAEPGNGAITPEEVLKNADKALYKAKKKGRNRVVAG